MDISQTSTAAEDRRNCVRFAVWSEASQAILSDGVTHITAVCVDQSSEGFGVCCDTRIPWSVGETVVLNREEGAHRVRIMYVIDKDGKAQLGVRRVGEVIGNPYPTGLRYMWRWLRKGQYFRSPSGWGFICASITGLLCVAVVILFARPTQLLNSGKLEIFGFGSQAEGREPGAHA